MKLKKPFFKVISGLATTFLFFSAALPVHAQNFDSYNPLKLFSSDPAVATQLSTPGGIVTRLLQFLIPMGGLILFIMILWGGFEIILSSTSGKKEAGQQRVTTAIIGFLLLFGVYWIAQLVQIVFRVNFLY